MTNREKFKKTFGFTTPETVICPLSYTKACEKCADVMNCGKWLNAEYKEERKWKQFFTFR